jgi:hypothetical protein
MTIHHVQYYSVIVTSLFNLIMTTHHVQYCSVVLTCLKKIAPDIGTSIIFWKCIFNFHLNKGKGIWGHWACFGVTRFKVNLFARKLLFT